MESSVASLLRENAQEKNIHFPDLFSSFFLYYKAGRKYFLVHPKAWLNSSAGVGYCGVIGLVPAVIVT